LAAYAGDIVAVTSTGSAAVLRCMIAGTVFTGYSLSSNNLLCWICGERPADSAEHKVQASDIRSICSHCNNAGTQVYDEAWRRLSGYLHANWRDITARGSFDLSKVFGAETAKQAVRVQLYFVKAFGCKLLEDGIRVDFGSFSAALMAGTAHPEVTLLVTSSLVPAGQMLSYESDVSVLRNGDDVYSAVWMNLVHPVGIKICYLKAGAPVREPPGFPWHPTRQKKIVKLSPYKGDAEPLVARRDLRI
jgi:hypothetical protein